MKLLIFSASTGGGHKRAAAALEDTIHRLNPEVEVTVVDGLRAIGKMAGGMADMGLVDALVREAKGFGLLGIIPFLLIGLVGHKWGLGILVLILWVIGPIIYAFVKNIVKNNQFAKKLTK